MNQLTGLSDFSALIPFAIVLASVAMRQIFKIPFAAAAAGFGAPIVLPLRELPFVEQFSNLPQAYLLGGSWGAIFCAFLLWTVCRPAVSGAVASLGFLRLGYYALLGGALVVTGLLIVNPEPLARNFPGWKGPAGIILLAASCLSVSQAVWKMVRATTLVALWGGVSIVLASGIFLDKLPQDIKREDLLKIRGLVSLEVVNKVFDYVQSASQHGAGVLKFLRVADREESQDRPVDA
jgi:hypothetical protein